jgi:hypothetical protein
MSPFFHAKIAKDAKALVAGLPPTSADGIVR